MFNDHLGNIRQTIDENGNIISAQDYAPYGEIVRSYNNADANDKYKFTEKERDKETNLDYFGARYYDAGIGRWLALDPLKEKYPSQSPYIYVNCSPINLVDKKGEEGDPWIEAFYAARDHLYSRSKEGGDAFTKAVITGGLIGTAALTGFSAFAFITTSPFVYSNLDKINKSSEFAVDVLTDGPSPSAGILDDLYKSATKSTSSGLSDVGRALQKHSARTGSFVEGLATGNNLKNTEIGGKILKNILNNGKISKETHKVFGKVTKIRLSDGVGAMFDKKKKFVMFLEKFTKKEDK